MYKGGCIDKPAPKVFAAIVAPTVFRTLGENDASIFLRTIFPKFFLFLSLISVANFFLALIDDQSGVMLTAAISATWSSG